jgi:hypothetical protein
MAQAVAERNLVEAREIARDHFRPALSGILTRLASAIHLAAGGLAAYVLLATIDSRRFFGILTKHRMVMIRHCVFQCQEKE